MTKERTLTVGLELLKHYLDNFDGSTMITDTITAHEAAIAMAGLLAAASADDGKVK